MRYGSGMQVFRCQQALAQVVIPSLNKLSVIQHKIIFWDKTGTKRCDFFSSFNDLKNKTLAD